MDEVTVAVSFAVILAATGLYGAWRAKKLAAWASLDRLFVALMPAFLVVTAFEFLGPFSKGIAGAGC